MRCFRVAGDGDSDLSGAERTVFEALSYSKGKPLRGIAFFDVYVPTKANAPSVQTDVLVITPTAITVVEVKGFIKPQNGLLELSLNSPWQISNGASAKEDAAIYSLKSSSNPFQQLRRPRYGVKDLLEKASLKPGFVSDLVVLTLLHGQSVEWDDARAFARRENRGLVVAGAERPWPSIRRFFREQDTGSDRYAASDAMTLMAALNLDRLNITEDDLTSCGFPSAIPLRPTAHRIPSPDHQPMAKAADTEPVQPGCNERNSTRPTSPDTGTHLPVNVTENFADVGSSPNQWHVPAHDAPVPVQPRRIPHSPASPPPPMPVQPRRIPYSPAYPPPPIPAWAPQLPMPPVPFVPARPRRSLRLLKRGLATVVLLVLLGGAGNNAIQEWRHSESRIEPVSFRTDSGVFCAVGKDDGGGFARCDVMNRTYVPPPHTCIRGVSGDAIVLRKSGAEFECVEWSIINPESPALSVGDTAESGPFKCEVTPTGVRCSYYEESEFTISADHFSVAN
jgi:hypothetical protein